MTQTPGTVRTLIIGASYGLLPAAKIAAAGHPVTVLGRPSEVAAISADGVHIHFADGQELVPPMGPGALVAMTPKAADLSAYDLVFLAIQEPQARAPEIAALLNQIGDNLPVVSLMNMPPPSFLDRIASLPQEIRSGAYSAEESWYALPASRMTLASPDPQVVRFDPSRPGSLHVTLASNFKFAPFERADDQALLKRIAFDASRVRGIRGLLPVHLLTRSSIFAPLAKWPMLVTGNCRCVGKSGVQLTIWDAVAQHPGESRQLYDAVNAALVAAGAPESVLVPFDSYAKAATKLTRPSSLARALYSGATAVERIDLVVLKFIASHNQDQVAVEILQRVSSRITQLLAANANSSLSVS